VSDPRPIVNHSRAAGRLRLGNQTAFSAADPLAPYRFALEHGLEAFEWFSDRKDGRGFSWDVLDRDGRRRVREETSARGMALSVHAPCGATPLDGTGRAAIAESIGFAADVGARVVIVHHDRREGPEGFAGSLGDALRLAADRGVRIAVENTVETDPEDCNRFLAAARRLGPGADLLGLCFDMGHANVCGATRNDYIRFLGALDPAVPIFHVHLHENWGDSDRHLLLFTGPSAADPGGVRMLIEMLVGRGFDGAAILEVWPDPPEALLGSIRRIEETIRQISGDREASARNGEPGAAGGPPAKEETPRPEAPPEPFALSIAAMNAERRSWRLRMEWVRDALAKGEVRSDRGKLVDLAAYLRFLGTGEVRCAEDAGHHRPNHHATLALEIERLVLEAEPRPPRALARRILRWLPSHDAPFRRAEPLTRIRDIAHRNDVPRDLKEEIKHALQNKLHRSAGPEDLATSERLLERVTRPGAGLPPDFVDAFRTFHRELEDFFNAGSLERELEAIAGAAGDEEGERVRREIGMLRSRADDPASLEAELSLVLDLRRGFSEAYRSVGDALHQRRRIAEGKLEDRAFALLSRCASGIE
jgi:sugar phosphate isomerase/epimerase